MNGTPFRRPVCVLHLHREGLHLKKGLRFETKSNVNVKQFKKSTSFTWLDSLNVVSTMNGYIWWHHAENRTAYLPVREVQRSPVVCSELVELVELEADVLDGELKHVPETSEVGGYGPRVGVGILSRSDQVDLQ